MATKDEIVTEARALFRRSFPEINEQQACLYLAACVIKVAEKHGIRLVLQAGSCFWDQLPDDLADGVSDTCFGYEWEPDSVATAIHLASGVMPELHVWAGDPITQEIVDLTTGFFPAQYKALVGKEWRGKVPPNYLWQPSREVDAEYRVYYDATKLASVLFSNYMRQKRLR